MCQWTLEVHPVCFHGLARPTYLDRCEAGQPAEEHPDGCPEAQGSEADPVCVPVRDALGLPCVDASCGFFRNGPRWECCLCKAVNDWVSVCGVCSVVVCDFCTKMRGAAEVPRHLAVG